MARRNKLVVLLLIQLLVILQLLVACSDDTTPNSTSPGRTTSANGNPPQTNGPNNALPTVPPPTPTYTPLPVPPTVAPTPTPPVIVGGKATGAVINDALTLHPYKANNATGQTYLSLLFAASLTRRDPKTLQSAPNAAASWTISDTTVTFTLKNTLKWSDGSAITSADYVWTYQQLKKPENGWSLAKTAFYDAATPGSNGIESYEAPDPHTLKIKLHNFSSDIVSRADVIEPLPQQVWSKVDWNDITKNPEIMAPTIVSGPWKLKAWKPGVSITFERNPNSTIWPSAHLDSLAFLVVPDSAVAMQKLKQTEIDFYTPLIADWAKFSQLANVQAYTWEPAQPAWYFAGFNFRRPLLQDKALRQALAWTLDRSAMITQQAAGLGHILNSSVSPWSPFFQPNTARYELNLDKAKSVLTDAGYISQNGKWLTKAGQPLPAFKLIYNAPSPLYEGLANTIKTNFAALGIEVQLSNFDYDTYTKVLASAASDYDLFLSGWTTDYAPENFGDVWRDTPELNSGAYQNQSLLDLYSKALNEGDAAKRQDLLNQIQAVEAEDLPYLFLYTEEGRLVVNKRLAGFDTGLLGPDRNLYTDWFVAH